MFGSNKVKSLGKELGKFREELTKIAKKLNKEAEIPKAGSSDKSVLDMNLVNHQPELIDNNGQSSQHIEYGDNHSLDISGVFNLLVKRLQQFDYMVKFISETKSEYDDYKKYIQSEYDILYKRYYPQYSQTDAFETLQYNQEKLTLAGSGKSFHIKNTMTCIESELKKYVEFTSKLASAKTPKKIEECIKADKDILSAKQYEDHILFITNMQKNFVDYEKYCSDWTKTKQDKNYENTVTSGCSWEH